MADRIHDIWGQRTPYSDSEWPCRVDEHVVEGPERWVQSACVLCSHGCAVDIGVKDGRIVGVRGRIGDRVNGGRLGPKGLYGWAANHAADRLKHPLVRRDGELAQASWDEALGAVVARSKEVLEKYGPGGIGFYCSGQMMLEEYCALAQIARAGIGTPHLDGNTRLCTATAASALIESFGCDGNPGSYSDYDTTDAIFMVGHNMAETQTVLWSRILDRRRGPRPPRLIVVDPRATATAKEADLHLRPRPGTNLALLNGLLRLVIENGKLDHEFIERHTVGFPQLRTVVESYTPERVEELTGVPQSLLREAGSIVGHAPRVVSSCLQGVYQTMQATASAVQVNNLHLIRGLIGKPGSTVFQMNGQPTAQNTRECGADGEMVAFRNWDNQRHIEELARLWNVEPAKIPHWGPPTHAMQIFRYMEMGSIRFLWVLATNPAVSLPELSRVRSLLRKKGAFVVVQDAFLTETAALADVVLPAAMWGERTGTFTNADRTVHIALKAVDPPGQARSDLDILIDYARRMDFRDKDGAPLPAFSDAQGAFDAFRAATRGRPCDYTGITYEKLTGASGIQWPCDERTDVSRERLYQDGVFPTGVEQCELYGHDLETGAAITEEEYRARDPQGRARIKAAHWQPPHEEPDAEFPFWLTTGRVVYHWHTRTKTGRVLALNEAAPTAFVQLATEDAARLGIAEGDLVEVESRRGRVRAPARIGDCAPGCAFMPFHYGGQAANELTLTGGDPVSKQPYVKYAAVRVRKVKP